MKRSTFELLENYMHTCCGDSIHDEEHIYRVLYRALQIAQTIDGVNFEVLIAACLLHDIARPEQYADPTVCHALCGGEKAEKFLLTNGFEAAFAAQVRACIETHRFRHNRQPQSIEAKILFDADKLDAAGTMGIARTLMYQGKTDQPLYAKAADGSIDFEPESFFHEYQFKLKNIYDRFYTDAGRQIALRLRADAAAFYDALEAEIDQSRAGQMRIFDHLTE